MAIMTAKEQRYKKTKHSLIIVYLQDTSSPEFAKAMAFHRRGVLPWLLLQQYKGLDRF